MTTKELYDFAENHHIKIDCLHLPQNGSFCLSDRDVCYIAIDPYSLETQAEEREHMAHELGHCATGSFYNRYSPLDLREQHEERATRWAIRALVNEKELEKAIQGGVRERWELAEYFDLPEPFMEKALQYYKSQKERARGIAESQEE